MVVGSRRIIFLTGFVFFAEVRVMNLQMMMMMVLMKAADDFILSLLDDCHPWVLNVKKADALMETIFKFCRHFYKQAILRKNG